MRRIARVDSNQPAIVKLFRKLGCSVALTHMVGRGFPDFIVGVNGKNIMVELKDGSKVPSARKLTKDEVDWHESWLGNVIIIESEEDVIELMGNIHESN